jgi:hypothetical protein
MKLLEYGMDSSTQPRISIQPGFKVNKAVFDSLDDADGDDSFSFELSIGLHSKQECGGA